MKLAIQEDRTIFTFDRDYGELIFRFQLHPAKGVIYLGLREYLPEEPGKLIFQLLQNGLSTANLQTVVDGDTVKQRQ
jgi:predicted nuclease of predicted toxin-antitoxin system